MASGSSSCPAGRVCVPACRPLYARPVRHSPRGRYRHRPQHVHSRHDCDVAGMIRGQRCTVVPPFGPNPGRPPMKQRPQPCLLRALSCRETATTGDSLSSSKAQKRSAGWGLLPTYSKSPDPSIYRGPGLPCLLLLRRGVSSSMYETRTYLGSSVGA